MPAFTPYDPLAHTPAQLVASVLAPASHIEIDPATIQLIYGKSQYRMGGDVNSIAFYDGSLTALGIGAGVFLSSGDGAPPASNTQSSYGVMLSPSHTDADLDATVHAVFPAAGKVKDATVLQFQFQLQQGSAIQFDLVFGSDEYPEFSDTSFVDIAAVYVNGVNYALFNGKTDQPLSVLKQNLAAGNFRANSQASPLPIEYDGVSQKLTIVAPAKAGVNELKIAIGDTGDQIYDSGVFVANLRAVDYQGAGLALVNSGTAAKDIMQGHDFNEYFELGAGDDILVLGKGDDVVLGGVGMDAIAYQGIFAPSMLQATASGYQLQLGDGGTKYLSEVELLYTPDSGLFTLDTKPGGMAWFVYALVNALSNSAPTQSLLSEWVAKGYQINDFGEIAQAMLDTYAPGLALATLITVLYQNLLGVAPSAQQIEEIAALVGPGKAFATAGELAAAAAQLELNTQEIAAIVGKPLAVNLADFV